MKKKPANPFLTTGYHSPEYFCDREKETGQLLSNLQNGSNTALVSIRRIGKTGLIKHLFYQLPENWRSIYVDILATENLSQFLNVMASAIMNALSEKGNPGKRFLNFLKTLRPVISYDLLTNTPRVSFNQQQTDETETSIRSILSYLEKQEFDVVIAIDEFQQITNYPERNIVSWLRGIVSAMGRDRLKLIF